MAQKLVPCKTCGQEIAKSAKKCPHCGKKRRLLERNPVGGILLIVLGVFIVIGIIGGGDSDEPVLVDNNTASVQNANVSPSAAPTPAPKTEFYVGETAEIRNIQTTLLSATQGIGVTYLRPEDGNVFVTCEFEVVNNSSSEISVSSLMCIDAYCDDYSISLDFTAIAASDIATLDGTIAPGKKLKGAVAYQVPEDWETIELIFTPDYWSGKDITFICTSDTIETK